ncbi:MAG: serine/threonine protein kinase [Planctomycetaceae bacterium]|jgi:serine/threonine-protein kinase|nr:serine/threonine protein kinase [Planctomycetaceae bacterium]MDP7278224.1 serine/threonine-protein kinase [Planctomycetaceae bacterium]
MPEVPEENQLEPADEQLFEALDGLVEAIHSGSGVEETVLLESYPELLEFVECLERLESLSPNGDPAAATEENSGGRTGTQFGRYELCERIGRGAMGVVYKARQVDLDRVVALKLIEPGRDGIDSNVDRFYSEARAAARLRHPNIVGILEVGDVDGQHYFAMDYVAGGSLAEHLLGLEDSGLSGSNIDDSVIVLTAPMGLWRRSAGQRRVEADRAAEWLVEIARAVDYLHAHGIVHRDLKPANVLLDEGQRPLVTDFGLARVIGDAATRTATGMIVGTPGYMAPEQASGENEAISSQSDIFSLGVILYEMLTGRAPFRVANPLDTLVRVIEVDPEPPKKLEPWLSRELERICLKCLEKRPRDRYASAAELADDLERYLRRENVQAHPGGFWHRFRRWGRRQPALVARLAAVGLVGGIVELAYLIGDDPDVGLYLTVMSLLGVWAVVSGGFQSLSQRPQFESLARYCWSVGDATLLTMILCQIPESPGPLLIAYPLLIVTAGLFFRVRLVWFMTLLCLLGYAALIVARRFQYPGLAEPPWQFPVIFAVGLAVVGFAVAYQVYRVRVLNRYFRRGGGE